MSRKERPMAGPSDHVASASALLTITAGGALASSASVKSRPCSNEIPIVSK